MIAPGRTGRRWTDHEAGHGAPIVGLRSAKASGAHTVVRGLRATPSRSPAVKAR